jgi:hypothetical protein
MPGDPKSVDYARGLLLANRATSREEQRTFERIQSWNRLAVEIEQAQAFSNRELLNSPSA